jgi:hypothetical protein
MHGGVVLWSPHELGKAPVLVIGEFQAGTIPAAACGLVDGRSQGTRRGRGFWFAIRRRRRRIGE